MAAASQGVDEAADLVEFGGAAVGDQEAEEAAGFDGAELAVVADEDELGVGRLDRLDQGGEIGGGQHGGLVDDHDFPGAEPAGGVAPPRRASWRNLATVSAGIPASSARTPGRHGRDGQAPDGGAFGRPGVPGGRDHAGLAGAGRPDHADEPLAALADPPQAPGLVGAEAVAAGGSLDGLGGDDCATPACAAPDEGVEDRAFPGQGLPGGVAGRAVAFVAGQAIPAAQPGGDLGGQRRTRG